MQLGYSRNTKSQRGFKSTLAFSASHEARRRMAVFAVQLAGICTRPASREALRRAAVKPRPTGISPYAPARIARSPGSRGTAPCASREACRRAALAPQPTRFPSCSPAPAGRGVGCRGTAPAREACRRAAVTPQPSCFPSSSPAPKGRGVGCRGTAPASRVRRRRGIGR